MSWLAAVDVRLWQAVIAGAFVAAGWLVNGWQNRREAARLRDEKLRDVHRALFAEIGANLANLGSAAELDSYCEQIVGRMRQDDGFVPFIPKERADRVFESIVENIHILPRTSIDPVVAYYGQIERIAALADDMRGAAFAALSKERQIDMYRDYIAMKRQALAFGDYAKLLIDAYAKGGRAGAVEAEARERRRLTGPAQ